MQTGVAEWCFDWHGMYPARGRRPILLAPRKASRRSCAAAASTTALRKTTAAGNSPPSIAYYERSANRAAIAPAFASPESGIGFRVVQAEMPSTKPSAYRGAGDPACC